uniref:Secreted protein n=1 Tax=Ascaris lumbricoides TaxID=6252 RepID=A0A0M3HH28_ASCLU
MVSISSASIICLLSSSKSVHITMAARTTVVTMVIIKFLSMIPSSSSIVDGLIFSIRSTLSFIMVSSGVGCRP